MRRHWRDGYGGRRQSGGALHFPHCSQIATSSISVTWGVPWDAGFVILSIDLVKISLFAQPNYQFPFRTTLSHDGVRRRLQASSTLSDSRTTSHDIARHGTADRHAQLLSSSQTSRGSCTDPRYKARATSAKNHAQAHAARSRYPLAHPRPHPAFRKPCNLPRPPQPARTITGPGPNAFELLKEDADQLGVGEGSEEAATPRRGLPTCRSDLAQQVRDGCPFLAEEEAQLEAAAARRSP